MRKTLATLVPRLVAAVLLVGSALAAGHWYEPVRVEGGSMRPALVHGDIAVVARRTDPCVGQIALVRSGSGMMLHRVRRIEADGGLATRGDANPIDDLQVTAAADVKGTVVGVVPVGAWIERVGLK